ncbi:MAG: glycosyltransferase [Pseudohaliea sp.]
MSCFNSERFLNETVESILKQTYGNFEFLIGDDCSTDRTRDLLKTYEDPRVRVFYNSVNLGCYKTANALIGKANGSLIARIDSDDVATPDRLAKQVAFLNSNPSVGCVGSNLTLIDESGDELTHWDYPEEDECIRWALMFNSAIAHPSSMFRLSAFNAIGGYDEDLHAAADYDCWVRMSRVCRLHNLQQRLVKYRIHENTVSSVRTDLQHSIRSRVSQMAIRESCGLQLGASLTFIDSHSHNDINELRTTLNRLALEFKKNYTSATVDGFINYSVQSLLYEQICKLPYGRRLIIALFNSFNMKPRQRLTMACPEALKRILRRNINVY